MTTVTDQTVHRQRAAALTTLTQLADQHSLPMPMDVTFSRESEPRRRLTIRLDDERPEGVKGWADILGLSEVRSMPVPASDGDRGFTSIHAERSNFDGPCWLDFNRIGVWSKCENGDDYGREPDNADDPQPVPSGVDGGPVGSGPGRTTGGA